MSLDPTRGPDQPQEPHDPDLATPAAVQALRGSFLGVIGLVSTLFLVLASGPLVPWWVVVAMTLVWLVCFALATQWFTRHPRKVALLPVWIVLMWFGAVLIF